MRHLTAKGASPGINMTRQQYQSAEGATPNSEGRKPWNEGDYIALHKPQPYINGTCVLPYQMPPLLGSIAKTTNFKP